MVEDFAWVDSNYQNPSETLENRDCQAICTVAEHIDGIHSGCLSKCP